MDQSPTDTNQQSAITSDSSSEMDRPLQFDSDQHKNANPPHPDLASTSSKVELPKQGFMSRIEHFQSCSHHQLGCQDITDVSGSLRRFKKCQEVLTPMIKDVMLWQEKLNELESRFHKLEEDLKISEANEQKSRENRMTASIIQLENYLMRKILEAKDLEQKKTLLREKNEEFAQQNKLIAKLDRKTQYNLAEIEKKNKIIMELDERIKKNNVLNLKRANKIKKMNVNKGLNSLATQTILKDSPNKRMYTEKDLEAAVEREKIKKSEDDNGINSDSSGNMNEEYTSVVITTTTRKRQSLSKVSNGHIETNARRATALYAASSSDFSVQDAHNYPLHASSTNPSTSGVSGSVPTGNRGVNGHGQGCKKRGGKQKK